MRLSRSGSLADASGYLDHPQPDQRPKSIPMGCVDTYAREGRGEFETRMAIEDQKYRETDRSGEEPFQHL
jgi:hypothetical protein